MANKVKQMLRLAATIAQKTTSGKRRNFLLGAIGIRNDGVLVSASNIPAQRQTPEAHAEYRVSRKLDVGAVVFVARKNRVGRLCNAKPCFRCESAMRSKGVKRCFYTISNTKFGVMTLS